MDYLVLNMPYVKELAYKQGISLSGLASKAQLSPATIFALQAKRRKASLRTACKLAAALDVSMEDIVE